MSHTVYRMFDADGTSIYVGCSADPWRRMSQHMKRDDLDVPIAHVHVTYHADRASAQVVEKNEIKRLQPVLNVRSAKIERHRHSAGALRDAVLDAMTELARPTTSRELQQVLGYSNVAAILFRLRAEGRVRVVGQVPITGRHQGRPLFLVELVPESERVAA